MYGKLKKKFMRSASG